MDYKLQINLLTSRLNELTQAYDEGHPLVSDAEWDKMYFTLARLEQQYQYTAPNSPTQQIPFTAESELKKVKHNHLMLSLAKTKEDKEVALFIGEQPCICMLKMDGLTCSLTYKEGVLIGAETRGDGEVGEDILHNALTVQSIPAMLPYAFTGSIDGEIICTYEDFETVNQNHQYKNPRNYAAGSIRLLDAKECAKRSLTFVAWDLYEDPFNDIEYYQTLSQKLEDLLDMGFITVPWVYYDKTLDIKTILSDIAKAQSYPIDGLVFKYNDCKYYDSLGHTSHHFNGGLAYKFYDELYDTRLRTIHWSLGRTGVLTPVAVFDPVDIDGTVVERASLHNVSIMQEILGDCAYAGQPLKIFKANQIIPQVYESVKKNYGEVVSHGGISVDGFTEGVFCPCCCAPATMKTNDSGVTVMVCENPQCEGKLLNQLDHFCGKKGLDIKGLSKKTLEKLIEWEYITSLVDIFSLSKWQAQWEKQDGFGQKSVMNILNAIDDRAKSVELWQVISAMGIPTIGISQSKALATYFKTWDNFRQSVDKHFNFDTLDGFGDVATDEILHWNYEEIDSVIPFLIIKTKEDKVAHTTSLTGITVVITGKLKTGTRDNMKQRIEAAGGRVTGSVSKKTDYLINNDASSTSAKNKKAIDLGVQIITEEDFIKKFTLDK